MLEFTAIDFETANSYRGSPCSVGLVKVRDGVIEAAENWLMRPPEGVDHFDYDRFHVDLHHIGPEMVADKPRWCDVLPEIVDFIGADVVVAHNAHFDIGVIRDACAKDGIECPELRFLCTLTMGKNVFSLPSYRLPFVAEAAKVPLSDHHNALVDAKAVANIVISLARSANANDLADLAKKCHVSIGSASSEGYQGSNSTKSSKRTKSSSRHRVPPETNTDADPDGYFYNRVVVFTGKLQTMTRKVAQERVAEVGGIPKNDVTGKTNILVIADVNPASLRPGAVCSSKAQNAIDRHKKGQDIEFMDEADFLQLL